MFKQCRGYIRTNRNREDVKAPKIPALPNALGSYRSYPFSNRLSLVCLMSIYFAAFLEILVLRLPNCRNKLLAALPGASGCSLSSPSKQMLFYGALAVTLRAWLGERALRDFVAARKALPVKISLPPKRPGIFDARLGRPVWEEDGGSIEFVAES